VWGRHQREAELGAGAPEEKAASFPGRRGKSVPASLETSVTEAQEENRGPPVQDSRIMSAA
jgi:hypothetical protein